MMVQRETITPDHHLVDVIKANPRFTVIVHLLILSLLPTSIWSNTETLKKVFPLILAVEMVVVIT